MRILLLLLICFPFFSAAQLNRSATELAKEKIHDYMVSKLGLPTNQLSALYGELEPVVSKNKDIRWSMTCIRPVQPAGNEKSRATTMLFFFNKQMNVLRAETYSAK